MFLCNTSEKFSIAIPKVAYFQQIRQHNFKQSIIKEPLKKFENRNKLLEISMDTINPNNINGVKNGRELKTIRLFTPH